MSINRRMDKDVVHICNKIFSSVQFSRSVVSDSLRSHESQHTRPPCPSPAPRVHSDPCPLSQGCHPAISSCRPLLLLPPIPPSIKVFSNESALRIRWPKYWSPQNKVWHCFHCFLIYFPWSDGTRCHASFSECWALSQLFHSPLSLSSRGFLVSLHFLPCHCTSKYESMSVNLFLLHWYNHWSKVIHDILSPAKLSPVSGILSLAPFIWTVSLFSGCLTCSYLFPLSVYLETKDDCGLCLFRAGPGWDKILGEMVEIGRSQVRLPTLAELRRFLPGRQSNLLILKYEFVSLC